MGIPKKHAKLIHMWAEGAQIQILNHSGKKWVNVINPTWDPTQHYRLAPAREWVRVWRTCSGEYMATAYDSTLGHRQQVREVVEEQPEFVEWVTDWVEILP